MKRLVFAIGVLALGFAATAPAHADFAIVKFNSGYCRIWADTSVAPADKHHLVAMAPLSALQPADLGDRRAQATRGGRSASLLALVISR